MNCRRGRRATAVMPPRMPMGRRNKVRKWANGGHNKHLQWRPGRKFYCPHRHNRDSGKFHRVAMQNQARNAKPGEILVRSHRWQVSATLDHGVAPKMTATTLTPGPKFWADLARAQGLTWATLRKQGTRSTLLESRIATLA